MKPTLFYRMPAAVMMQKFVGLAAFIFCVSLAKAGADALEPEAATRAGMVVWLLLAVSGVLLLALAACWRQRRELAEVRDAELRLRLVLEAAPTAMVKIDAAGRISLVNAQAEACFGYSRAEMLGQPIEMLVPQRFRHGHMDFRQVFLQRPQARAMGAGRELFGLRKDGSEFPLEIGLNPVQTERGIEVLSSVVDITARKRLEDRFRLVVEATPNAVVVTNQQGVIELVNSQTEALFGYSRDELLGQSIEILVPQNVRKHHQQVRRDYLAAPQPRAMGAGRDLFALRKDGSEFPVEIGLSPISSESGSLVLSSIIDISARKRAESQLQQQAEELATASRYKSEFLANMSHELRTPLNSILILSEQLRDNGPGNLNPRQREHADIIYRSGCDLLGLINDILDLSKIEAGRVSVCHEPIVLDDLCDNVRRIFTPMAEQKRLQFEVSTAAGVPQVVISDYQRLFQILKNLISNALKFTQQGQVQVVFQMPEGNDSEISANWLEICVIDSGPGIPADKHELIFQAFQQADGSTSRQYGGTGLGLTISRQLAALLGGRIELQSEPGRGSHFILYLPLMAPEHGSSVIAVSGSLPCTEASSAGPRSENVIEEQQPAPASVARDETILLVDDDVRNIYAMTSLLEMLGFEVEIARNGEDAIKLINAREDIDLVLMDMMMPVLDGYQATSRLREQWQFSRPIIAVTACAMKGDREKCLAAGADDYLPKPVQRGELEAMIRKWLDQQGSVT